MNARNRRPYIIISGDGQNEIKIEFPRLPSKKFHTVHAVLVACLVLGSLAITYFVLTNRPPIRKRLDAPDPEHPLPPSPSKSQKFRHGAVCSDGPPCSKIGRGILARNGTAVDAAVATLFCNGLVSSQSMGLGGGCMMVIYDEKTGGSHAVIARESAPLGISEKLFEGNQSASRDGVLSIGVPGELKGYWAVHQKFGKLPWADVIQPTIELCENGYAMSKHQRDSLDYRDSLVRSDPYLKELFVNSKTGSYHPVGTVIKAKTFCQTLRVIAKEGGDALYTGSLADLVVEDIQKAGGIITKEDLRNYRIRWSDPIKTDLAGNLTLLGVPPPGSGALLAFILNILDGFHFNPRDLITTEQTVKDFHYIVEAFKFAFAKRGEIGDPDFTDISELMKNLSSCEVANSIREQIRNRSPSNDPRDYDGEVYMETDHGTAHVSVIDAEGSAVSVTSSVNLYFGAGVTSASTGIILNSGMDDFSFPNFENYFGLGWSPANRLAPGKMSLSSMCPTIVLENGKIRLVLGASGGTKITTAVALVFMRHLWFGEDLKSAVDASRFHHQLVPPTISYEFGMLKKVREGLEAMGHNLTLYRDRGSIICALSRLGKWVYGNADYRKGGEVYGI